MVDTKKVLEKLGIKEINPGGFNGEWILGKGTVLDSVSPIDGKVIAKVQQITDEELLTISIDALRKRSEYFYLFIDYNFLVNTTLPIFLMLIIDRRGLTMLTNKIFNVIVNLHFGVHVKAEPR